MRIHELVSNPEFSFNTPYRILHYLEGDTAVKVYDSREGGEPTAYQRKDITAINTGDDGILEIEYTDFDLGF